MSYCIIAKDDEKSKEFLNKIDEIYKLIKK